MQKKYSWDELRALGAPDARGADNSIEEEDEDEDEEESGGRLGMESKNAVARAGSWL